MSLKKLLVKAGLVVDENQSASIDDVFEAEPDVIAAEPIPADLPVEVVGVIATLDEIYAQHNVPMIAFPAERLLKILDGLGAMDPANQRAAIAAMDAADDNWDLSQVLADANNKVTALRSHASSLDASIISTRDDEAAQKSALIAQYEGLRKEINDQIAQLHSASELATAEHTQAMQELQSQSNAAVAATQQEQVRLRSEMQRLESISRKLGGSIS